MGPKRFGTAGKLAFSFGNVAQDEGSAMAEYAYRRGWRTANLATNTLLVYFKNVVQAFEKRFTQLGGKIAGRESYATGANNVNAAVSRLNAREADVIVTSTAFGELPALVKGLRSLGNKTPILNSWAGDGTYWVAKNPQVTTTTPSPSPRSFGDDPIPAVRALAKQLKACTGGFVTGSAAIDGVVTAIRRSGGSTNGARLAATMEKFRKVPTLSGPRQLLAAVPHRLRAAVPRDQDPQQQGALRRAPSRPRSSRRSSGLTAAPRPHATRGGPGRRSGPPPCRARSRACRRSTRSRSSCTGTRSSA